jgi:hypothetical protein
MPTPEQIAILDLLYHPKTISTMLIIIINVKLILSKKAMKKYPVKTRPAICGQATS